MHVLATAACAALLLGAAFTPARAAVAPDALDAWVDAVTARAERATLIEPATAGMVTVRFRRGADGTPTDLRVIGAAPKSLQRAGRDTVNRLGELPQFPSGVAPDTSITLQLLFNRADTVRLAGRRDGAKLATMKAAAAASNAQFAARHYGGSQLASAQRDPR